MPGGQRPYVVMKSVAKHVRRRIVPEMNERVRTGTEETQVLVSREQRQSSLLHSRCLAEAKRNRVCEID